MTEKEIWAVATAGDGSLDPVLAQELQMPLEEFLAEKQRRIDQYAEEQRQQEEINRHRSIGSMGGDTGEELEDPTADARQYLERMEDAYHADRPIDGQQTLPGFEVQEDPAAQAPLDAETIKKNIGRVSFKVDYMKSPEDALIGYNVPAGALSEYLARHFQDIVKIAAEETGADPDQIADKNQRTPEQERLLNEIAGRMQIARFQAFFASTYYNALTVLDPLQGTFKDPRYKEQYTAEELLTDFNPNIVPVKEQAVLYFFATHESIKPTAPGELTDQQAEELRELYFKLDAFYAETVEIGEEDTGEYDIVFSKYFAEFILRENPPKEAAEILEAITVKQIDSLLYPLDKPNSTIWDSVTIADKNGQLQYAIDTGKHGAGTPAIVCIGLDFGELPEELTKNLDALDKRLMMASDALYHAGNEYCTDTQLYKSMGYKGNPGKSDLQKINDRLTKLGTGRIYINNEKEVQQNRSYPKYVYDGNILPFERIRGPISVNGKPCEAAIHFFRDPPLMDFARKRKQITAIPLELLESPINKTEENLAIEDYLLERIGHMKSSKGTTQRKILFKTLCARCNITKAKQIQRAPAKIYRYLDHFKTCKWIKDYEQETDGVKIIL